LWNSSKEKVGEVTGLLLLSARSCDAVLPFLLESFPLRGHGGLSVLYLLKLLSMLVQSNFAGGHSRGSQVKVAC
jgi:hypothetical protein